ncbi:MAG: DUF2630 family protein [Actinomycetota bacterium]
MASDEILLNIQELAHEEHELRERESRGELSQKDQERLRWLEDRLDQCWDLLRQRRARVSAGLDPDEASVREVDTVEHYRQ